MSKLPPKPNDTIQAQVEQLTSDARKLSSAGKEAQALESYCRAADLMPGAPWLQYRTAELARKLKQPAIAAHHYRRASVAFVGAGFPKRALAPLRAAWALGVAALPGDARGFASLSLDLAELLRGLGFHADAVLSIASANDALEAAGCTETALAVSEPELATDERGLRASDPAQPPESGVKPSSRADPLEALMRVRSGLKR